MSDGVAHAPIEGVELVWLHRGASWLGDDLPVQRLVLGHQGIKLAGVIRLHASCHKLEQSSRLALKGSQRTSLACGDLSAADLASAAAFLAASSLVMVFSLVLAAADSLASWSFSCTQAC